MPLSPGHPAVLRYVDERRCDDGGYCFYRLPEPNAADTRYALAVRSRLGQVPADPATVAFLRSLQGPEGSFPNVFVAGHVLAGLALLGTAPLYDPGEFLLSRFAGLGDHERPPEQLSALEGVRVAVEACGVAGASIDDGTRGAVLRHVRSFRRPGGGFGAEQPTIAETADALAVLTLLGRLDEAAGASAFVAAAESPRDGFLFLEPAAALARASLLLRQPLRRPRPPPHSAPSSSAFATTPAGSSGPGTAARPRSSTRTSRSRRWPCSTSSSRSRGRASATSRTGAPEPDSQRRGATGFCAQSAARTRSSPPCQ